MEELIKSIIENNGWIKNISADVIDKITLTIQLEADDDSNIINITHYN